MLKHVFKPFGLVLDGFGWLWRILKKKKFEQAYTVK